MSKTLIFTDTETIANASAPLLDDASRIQNLLNLIGTVQAPAGWPAPKTELDLVKALVEMFEAIDYLTKIMVVKQDAEVLRKALAAVVLNHQGQRMNFDFFSMEGGVTESCGMAPSMSGRVMKSRIQPSQPPLMVASLWYTHENVWKPAVQ